MSRPNGGKATLLYYAYRAISAVLAPFAWYSVARKLRRAHVPVERQHERLGVASQPRPAGQLIWFHAASVGESLSVLSLITRMGERLPQAQFLITSGTATSAALIAKRLPPRTIHQYPPLDANGPVNRFYHHWRPNAGIFVESELWPQMLVKGRKAGVHLALLNARLSDKSVRGWQRFPDTAQYILGQFDLFLTQNQKTANNLRAMGAVPERVKPGTNLKALSGPLPVDEVLCARMRKSIGDRPVWVASSTHPGEEEVVLQTHRALLKRHPDLLLLLIPRHPDRGQDVQQLIANFGFTCARRSKQEDISPETEVYLADTLGETGTWYALCPLVFLGGSLQDIGGHNPFEPAQAGAAVITGPGFFNFAETFDAMIAAGGAVEVCDAVDLTAAVDKWLSNQSIFETACTAARSYVNTQQTALDSVIDTLCEELKL